MNRKHMSGAAGFVFAALIAAGPARAVTSSHVPMDSVTEVYGINAVCTGAGLGDRNRVEWRNYPVKFEFVGDYGQYLGDGTLTVTGDGGREVVSVQCQGPWVLMNLTPGHYCVRADVLGAPATSVDFDVPSHGQRNILLRFPDKTAGVESKRGT